MKITYQFTGKIWQYAGPAGWHFVSLSKNYPKKSGLLLKKRKKTGDV